MSRPLEGRVAVITGSSRGIGRALALRLAEEGADLVITGKSVESTERLPGSIHTVAAEVAERGRRALAIQLDVRHEEQIESMVERTVAEYGRLDILVNNAGALWWEPVLETPAKRFDLMWSINVRASFLCAQHALPHMVDAGWGHIVNCSPPISLTPNPGHVAYMATKMGMTRVAIGIAAEHAKDGVAANSLWPVTPIESQATINWEMGDRSQWRSPEILCDAAVELLSSEPPSITGRQILDEEFLLERGWTQERIDGYWVGEGPPEEPIWIDGRPAAMM